MASNTSTHVLNAYELTPEDRVLFREQSNRSVLERWTSAWREIMEFRLIYRGSLPPDKRGSIEEKHAIRKQVHRQLKTLWNQHPFLKGLFSVPSHGHPRVHDVADSYARCGFRFVPLVRQDMNVACSLEFLLLRRGEQFSAFNGQGDLDNRMKSFIDGLKMPQQCNQLPPGAAPDAEEDPFFCLLEDDKLVFDFSVTTGTLLVPPDGDEIERDVYASILVRVKATAGPFSIYDF